MRKPPLVMHGCGHQSRAWSARPLCGKCRKAEGSVIDKVQRDPFRPRQS